MSKIIEIEGIGPAITAIFEECGISTVEQLLERGKDARGRKSLEEETGLPHRLILRWTNMADLFRIKGVAEEYSDLLEAAGVDTVAELKMRNPANLHARMVEVNDSKKLVRKLPTEGMVAKWVTEVGTLPRVMTY